MRMSLIHKQRKKGKSFSACQTLRFSTQYLFPSEDKPKRERNAIPKSHDNEIEVYRNIQETPQLL